MQSLLVVIVAFIVWYCSRLCPRCPLIDLNSSKVEIYYGDELLFVEMAKNFHAYHAYLIICDSSLVNCKRVEYTTKKKTVNYIDLLWGVDARIKISEGFLDDSVHQYLGSTALDDLNNAITSWFNKHQVFNPINVLLPDLHVEGITCHDFVRFVVVRFSLNRLASIYSDFMVIEAEKMEETCFWLFSFIFWPSMTNSRMKFNEFSTMIELDYYLSRMVPHLTYYDGRCVRRLYKPRVNYCHREMFDLFSTPLCLFKMESSKKLFGMEVIGILPTRT